MSQEAPDFEEEPKYRSVTVDAHPTVPSVSGHFDLPTSFAVGGSVPFDEVTPRRAALEMHPAPLATMDTYVKDHAYTTSKTQLAPLVPEPFAPPSVPSSPGPTCIPLTGDLNERASCVTACLGELGDVTFAPGKCKWKALLTRPAGFLQIAAQAYEVTPGQVVLEVRRRTGDSLTFARAMGLIRVGILEGIEVMCRDELMSIPPRPISPIEVDEDMMSNLTEMAESTMRDQRCMASEGCWKACEDGNTMEVIATSKRLLPALVKVTGEIDRKKPCPMEMETLRYLCALYARMSEGFAGSMVKAGVHEACWALVAGNSGIPGLPPCFKDLQMLRDAARALANMVDAEPEVSKNWAGGWGWVESVEDEKIKVQLRRVRDRV